MPKHFPMIAILACLASGCGHVHPKVYKDIHGEARIYPDVLDAKPSILAFLSANDRRCDRELQSLWGLSKRGSVKIVGVMVYDSLSYVTEVSTLDYAQGYPVLLDPKRELARRYRVKRYPTYVFLAHDGDVLDRAYDLRDAEPWTSEQEWLDLAQPPPASEVPAKGEEPRKNVPPAFRL